MAAFSKANSAGWAVNERLTSVQMNALDGDHVKAPNLVDGGATYSPTDPVIVAGAGIHVSGTGWRVLSAANLIVNTGGFITIGSGGTATLRVLSGALAQIQAGGALDVAGSLTLKTTGAGSFTAETGTTATWNSGSTATFATGSTVNLSGTTNVRGAVTFKSTANGGPGSLVFESDASALISSTAITWAGTSVQTYVAGATVAGVHTRTGRTTYSGSSARNQYRSILALSASADGDITVATDRAKIPLVLTGNRLYTLRHTGTVPTEGERLYVYRTGTTAPSAHTAKIITEGSLILFSFYNSRQGFAEFEFNGASWECVGGFQSVVGTSGYYDDAWV